MILGSSTSRYGRTPSGSLGGGAGRTRRRRAATRARDTGPVRPPTHAAPRTPTSSAPTARAVAKSRPERLPASAANSPAARTAATHAATASGDSIAKSGASFQPVSCSGRAALGGARGAARGLLRRADARPPPACARGFAAPAPDLDQVRVRAAYGFG